MNKYKYLISFDNVTWTDISQFVNTNNTTIKRAFLSSSYKSSMDTFKFSLTCKPHKNKEEHSNLFIALADAMVASESVYFSFYKSDVIQFKGVVDKRGLSQVISGHPEQISITVYDNTYLLDKDISTEFEYPLDFTVDTEGWYVFKNDNTSTEKDIIITLLQNAGFSTSDINFDLSSPVLKNDGSNDYRTCRYIADDEDSTRTYLDLINTLLHENCKVLTTGYDGRFIITDMYKKNPTITNLERDYMVKNGTFKTTLSTRDYDGVKLEWSELSIMEKALLYDGNLGGSIKDDGSGYEGGFEMDGGSYWPETSDIEEVWQEYSSSWLDRPYYTESSRLKNDDLSLLSAKNIFYEAFKDDEIELDSGYPYAKALKAMFRFKNTSEEVKEFHKFDIWGEALFRYKINDYTYPNDCLTPEEYTSEFIYSEEQALEYSIILAKLKNYGIMQYAWSQNKNILAGSIWHVTPRDSKIDSDVVITSVTEKFFGNISYYVVTAQGFGDYTSEEVRKTSKNIGINTGTIGKDGINGADGADGENGLDSYFHVAWANDSTGSTDFSTTESLGKLYIGTYSDNTNADSNVASDYNWTKIKGEKGDVGEQGIQGIQGIQGSQGEQGIQGEKGDNGLASYFHIKYSDYSDGTNMNETGGNYIGTYVDYTESDSTNKDDYNWVLVKGAQGEDGSEGIPGVNGTNGLTSYLHIAYANNSTGSSGFSTTDSTDKLYIGQYTDFTSDDSDSYSDYNWTKIKGEQGVQGATGATGATGEQGIQGIDGDFGILTLSFNEATLNLTGNGQASGYIIYNNQKFYMSSNYTCLSSGDGVIIADISQSPVVVRYDKLVVENDVLSFVDFNTGINGITKADVDSQWQYLLIGEFSTINDYTVINASLKTPISAKTFLSNEFTSILRSAILDGADIEAWAKAMGCEEYYNALAVSKLFAGQIFTQELTLSEGGVIKSNDANESVRIQADGLARFKNLILEFDGNTMFKVDSATGNVNFGYDTEGNPLFYFEQASKTIKSKNNNFMVGADGAIIASSVDLSGVINAESGLFGGQLDTVTLLTMMAGDDIGEMGDITSTEELIGDLLIYGDSNINIKSNGTINGNSLVTSSYGTLHITKGQAIKTDWTYSYRISYVIANVSATVNTDYGNYNYMLRKINVNVNWKDRDDDNDIDYPSYPPTPSSILETLSLNDFTKSSSPSTFTESFLDKYGYDRAYGGDILNFEIYDTTKERLYIKSLPTQLPSESNRVWNDNGTLKIT